MRLRLKRTIFNQRGVHLLWSSVYKGIEIVGFGRMLWIGYTPREWRNRGW